MKLLLSVPLGAIFLASKVSAVCFAPEPADRICYNKAGATPQNISLKELTYVAGYLRFYGSQAGNPRFYTMPLPTADNCAEWQVTTKGSTWVMAKLVGDDAASVLFDDIANTIDGGPKATPEQKAAALYGCATDGGQVAVKVNTSDPRYQQEQFVNGTFTNQGIVIKLVRNPGVKETAV
ncbi:hypothetical protein AAL_06226 [Moelleriella libera RCEF 2490]|uniref:Uncharacterized protein n=1 Tax=Moelleriella libera RCEF 2490 TaxID=1081109 RepID=A0A166NUX5_9HYPO|nr:hypothetical protein AAL_06226 [Moelleriella libera RCEF 2490]